MVHLGELLDHPVLRLDGGAGLGDRHAGERGRHVEDRALVQRRHELGPEPEPDRDREGDDQHGRGDRQPAEAEDDLHDGVVEAHERAADRVAFLAVDRADQNRVGHAAEPARPERERLEPGEQKPHRRIEGDRQDGRDRHREVLGEGERPEEPSLLRLEREDGEERDRDHQQREEARPAHLLDGPDDHRAEVAGTSGGLPVLELLVGLLDDDDRRVHHRADRHRDPAERHDVGRDVHRPHGDERQQDGDRNREDRDERARDVPEEDQDDEAHDRELLHQRVPEGIDRPVDEVRAIVGADDLHPGREGPSHLLELPLDALDDLEGILSMPHHDHAADCFAVAIQLDEPAPEVGTEMDATDVADQDRRPAAVRPDGDLLDVLDRAHVAPAADQVFGPIELDQAAADLVVRPPDRLDDVAERQPVAEERRRVDLDLVLLHEAADRGDLGHAVDARQPVAQVPVLERAQVGERVLPAAVDEGVLVYPPHTRRVGPEAGADALRQPAGDALHVLEDAAPRPVEVRAVLEHDVDERVAEHRFAADILDAWRGDHRRDDRVGDLVLHDVRAAPGPVGEDDHLHVREVWDRVERARAQRPDTEGRREEDKEEDDEAVVGAVLDDAVDHLLRSPQPPTRTMNFSRAAAFPGCSI